PEESNKRPFVRLFHTIYPASHNLPAYSVQKAVHQTRSSYLSRKMSSCTLWTENRDTREQGVQAMKIGYIRVSKDTQATILQEDAMKHEECKRVFTDRMTGKRFDRPEYLRMLDLARPGDVIVVWRLDRLGRSLKELIETVTDLAARGIELKS